MEALLVEKGGLQPSVVWEKFCTCSSLPTQEGLERGQGLGPFPPCDLMLFSATSVVTISEQLLSRRWTTRPGFKAQCLWLWADHVMRRASHFSSITWDDFNLYRAVSNGMVDVNTCLCKLERTLQKYTVTRKKFFSPQNWKDYERFHFPEFTLENSVNYLLFCWYSERTF